MKFEGNHILVTGAGSGIGRALTQQLVSVGAHVIALDIDKEQLAETQHLCSTESISCVQVDVSDKPTLLASIQEVLKEHTIDGLINNAGIIQDFVDLKDLDDVTIEKVMNVNFFAPLNIIKAVIPTLLQKSEAFICNVSSMGGFLPVPGQSLYGASKAALKLLTEGLYAEMKDTNVRVSVVYPGAVATNIMKNSGVNMDKMAGLNEKGNEAMSRALSADKAASIILQGIKNNKLHIIAGKDSRMMYYMYRLAPKRAVDMIVKQMGYLRNKK